MFTPIIIQSDKLEQLQKIPSIKQLSLFDDSNNNYGKNILIITTNPKGKKMLNRLLTYIVSIYSEGSCKKINDLNELELFILSQKNIIPTYNIPDSLLIIDSLDPYNNYYYQQILKEKKELHITTITIINNVCDIRKDLLNKMDIVITLFEKNKLRAARRNTLMWEQRFYKYFQWKVFRKEIAKGTGALKAVVIKSNGSMYSLKLSRENTTFEKLLPFSKDKEE